jgi:plasmid replication initiation protein
MTDNNKELNLNKSSAAISFNSNGGKVSLVQHRCINSALFSAQRQIHERYRSYEEFEQVYGNSSYDFSVPWKTFLVYMGWRSNATDKAKDAINALEELRFSWDILKENGDESVGFQRFITKAEITNGVLKFRMDHEVRKKLLSDEANVELNILVTNRSFNNKYASFLYEHLCNVLKASKETEWVISIDDFREIMNIPYEKNGKQKVYSYPTFSKLRIKVIEVAINGINQVDDFLFTVEYEKIKEGNLTTALKFFISDKPISKDDLLDEELELTRLAFEGSLRRFGLYESVKSVLDSNIEEEYQFIVYCFRLYERAFKASAEKNNPIGAPVKYFKAMLNQNRAAFDIHWKEEQKKVKSRSLIDEGRRLQAQTEIEISVTNRYREEITDSFMVSCSPEVLEDIQGVFTKSLGTSSPTYKQIRKGNWTSKLVIGPFREFLIEREYCPIDDVELLSRQKTELKAKNIEYM